MVGKEEHVEERKDLILGLYERGQLAGLVSELSLVLEVDSPPAGGVTFETQFFLNEIARKTKENKRAAGRFWQARSALADFLKR